MRWFGSQVSKWACSLREWRERGGGRMNRERLLNVDWGSREQEKMIREVENCEGSGSWKPRGGQVVFHPPLP